MADEDGGGAWDQRRLTILITGIALLFVLLTGVRGLRVPPPTCAQLVEVGPTIGQPVLEPGSPTAGLDPGAVEMAACLRVRDDDGARTALVQLLVCSRDTEDVAVPFERSAVLALVRVLDDEGAVVRELPPRPGVRLGSFGATLEPGSCFVDEQELTPADLAGAATVEAASGIAFVDDGEREVDGRVDDLAWEAAPEDVTDVLEAVTDDR